MKPLLLLGLWCLTTTVSLLAAETSPGTTLALPPPSPMSLLAGPWLLLGEDGLVRCGMEVGGTLEPSAIRLLRGPEVVPAPVVLRPLHVSNRPPATVVEILLPAGPGAWTVAIAGRRLAISVAAPPAADAPSRVVFAGRDNWPRAQDLAAVAGRIGGAVQLVVAYGRQAAAMLGSGGWEDTVPVVVLPQAVPSSILHAERLELIAGARLGGLGTHWGAGLRWGVLGLPWVADPTTAASVVARDLSPWEVCLVPASWWELGLLAPRIDRQGAGTAPLIALCGHLQVPLILTLGSGAGWVSDPLVVDDERVRARAGGVRVVAATPAGDGLALLPMTVASAIDHPGIIGLLADRTRLALVGIGFAGGDLLHLEVQRAADGSGGFTGDGVGRSGMTPEQAMDMRTTWLGKDDVGIAARAQARWLAVRELTTLHVEPADVLALVHASADVPGLVPVLRRLTGIEEVVETGLAEHQALLPPLVQRDLLLRHLARPAAFDPTPWRRLMATTSDAHLLSAIVRAHQDGTVPGVLDLLVARVQAQAAGSTPPEADALLEHRLMTAVFDATTLSPTLLRPLAVALRPRLDAFTGGPVVRFLTRHGEVRGGDQPAKNRQD